MQENLKDILSNLSTSIDQETLLLYLQGKLSAEQQHEVEKKMLDDDFDNDAFEGLQNFTDKRNIQSVIDQLNLDLKNKTAKKKEFRNKLKLKNEPWLRMSILILLLLIILSYFIIHKILQQ